MNLADAFIKFFCLLKGRSATSVPEIIPDYQLIYRYTVRTVTASRALLLL